MWQLSTIIMNNQSDICANKYMCTLVQTNILKKILSSVCCLANQKGYMAIYCEHECYKTIVMEKLAIVSGREGICNKLDMPEFRSWDL